MLYYLITFSNGVLKHGYFSSYFDALDYAQNTSKFLCDCDFTIDEYESEEDFFNNI